MVVLKNCTDAISDWMLHNGLSLNPSQSEVIEFGTAQTLHKSNIQDFNVAGSVIAVSDQIKSLGVILDKRLSFDTQQNMQGHTVPRKVLPTHQEFSTGHPGPYRGKFDRIPPGLLQLSTCRNGTNKRHQTTTCPEQHRAHRHWNKPLRPHSTSAQGPHSTTALATC